MKEKGAGKQRSNHSETRKKEDIEFYTNIFSKFILYIYLASSFTNWDWSAQKSTLMTIDDLAFTVPLLGEMTIGN